MKQIIVDGQVTPYYITEKGQCYNQKTARWLKGQISKSGYLNYNLSSDLNQSQRLYAHRLVAQYFLNNGEIIPKGLEVNHRDGNKLNNYYKNLELTTHQENMQHASDMNLIHRNKIVYQFDEHLRCVHSYRNLRAVVEQTGFNYSVIRKELLARQKTLTYHKYYWSYQQHLKSEEVATFSNKGVSKIVYQYDKTGKLISSFQSTGQAAKILYPSLKRAANHISECCRGKIKTYKGYIWRYADDIV